MKKFFVSPWTVGDLVAALAFAIGSIIVLLAPASAILSSFNTFWSIGITELEIQHSMARSSLLAAFTGVFSLFAAIVGAVLVFVTYRETKKTAQIQLRAYVVTGTGGIVSIDGDKVETAVDLKNVGQTPALYLSAVFAVAFLEHPAPRETVDYLLDYVGYPEEVFTTLGAGEKHRFPYEDDFNDNAKMQFQEFLNGNLRFAVFGRATYRDVYNRKFETEFFHTYEHDEVDGQAGSVHWFGNHAT